MTTTLVYPFVTETVGDVTTTPEFWDCECDVDYIHPASQFRCHRCGFSRDECPDSHADEVMKFGLV